MAHIANKIVAQDKPLSAIFTDARYKIDVFQRDFRWQYKQIEALLNDLASSFLSNLHEGHTLEDVDGYDCYYMGPIVLCEDNGSLSVVDGQQRLTSFTLLLIYLMHLQEALVVCEDDAHELNKYLRVTRGGKRTYALDIPSRKVAMDAICGQKNLEAGVQLEESSSSDEESIHNMLSCYDNIKHLFPAELKTAEKLPLFIEWLLHKVILVEIRAFSMDNAYTIFETMNDRGLNLDPTEILKGHILSKVSDEEQSEEMNDFWKQRIAEIKYNVGGDADMAFFRAWFRAKYAQTIKQGLSDEEMKDYEQIGSRFHSWFKNNQKLFHLSASSDYYNFIKGDFDFYSQLYIDIIYRQRKEGRDERNDFYLVGCYPLAESLYFSLILSPVMARDSQTIIDQKTTLINSYVDALVNRRVLLGKSVSQGTLRKKIFDLSKKLRNESLDVCRQLLREDLLQLESTVLIPTYTSFPQQYMHYVLARIRYHLNMDDTFESLLRTRKQTSYVLCQIFNEEEWEQHNIGKGRISCWSLVNYCICRRADSHRMPDDPSTRIMWLAEKSYLPEMTTVDTSLQNFIEDRYQDLNILVQDIWPLHMNDIVLMMKK